MRLERFAASMKLSKGGKSGVQPLGGRMLMKIGLARQPASEFPKVSRDRNECLAVACSEWSGQLRKAAGRHVTEYVVDRMQLVLARMFWRPASQAQLGIADIEFPKGRSAKATRPPKSLDMASLNAWVTLQNAGHRC